MAIYAGTCRVTSSNILESFVKSDILCKENGYIIIKDMDKLKRCIN